MAFSFGFSGDDIEESVSEPSQPPKPSSPPQTSSNNVSAFPIQGKPLLAPQIHDLSSLISTLPSKIAYSVMTVNLGSDTKIELPRRELMGCSSSTHG